MRIFTRCPITGCWDTSKIVVAHIVDSRTKSLQRVPELCSSSWLSNDSGACTVTFARGKCTGTGALFRDYAMQGNVSFGPDTSVSQESRQHHIQRDATFHIQRTAPIHAVSADPNSPGITGPGVDRFRTHDINVAIDDLRTSTQPLAARFRSRVFEPLPSGHS